ncbi:MAG TPA: hypothetical protein VFY85_05765 [Gemmatimonadaceae bacterium]|nr:hypothetical protein [Gemmatimonadaceae bacterium]
MFGLQRWKPGTLLATWVAYWAGLIGVSIGPGLFKAWRLTRAPGSHGTASASFDNGKLLFDVNDAAGAGAWSFHTSMAAAIAWIAIPPLALWVLWMISRPRRDAHRVEDPAMLHAPQPVVSAVPGVPSRHQAERVEHRS